MPQTVDNSVDDVQGITCCLIVRLKGCNHQITKRYGLLLTVRIILLAQLFEMEVTRELNNKKQYYGNEIF